ncbi:signal transduction histidine-kinase BaeS domain protein [Escherichia coli]|nr:signal transduction histidine-kinase BaeS domain protein [Escherichia coli]
MNSGDPVLPATVSGDFRHLHCLADQYALAVRISFERGFIDYIKHGNEQRLQLLSDALGEQYGQHGNWRFLRNNDRFVFQILRSFEHDNSEDKPGPGMPPHGWRTQFWVVDQNNKVLVGPRAPIPPDGTRRPILVNGAEVGAVIASLLSD